MKKTLIYILGVSAGILTASTLLGFRRLTGKKLNSVDIKGKKVLFIGDSHTALYNSGWQSILAKRYGFTEVNKAVGGKRTSWMISVLNSAVAQDIDYYACFIYGGANDAYSGVTNEQAVKNIQAMVDTCNAKKIIPVVIVGYNTRKLSVGNTAMKTTTYVPTQKGMWELAEKRYQQQLLMQRSIKNAIVVPMWQDVSDATAPNDAIHLYGQAQTNFANYVASKLFT
jgi:lysophospholipase L1-like esterase